MTIEISDDANLDTVLTEIGAFGIYHIFAFIILNIPNTISGMTNSHFAFSSISLEHRCKVTECDVNANNREIQFDQPWLSSAIPFSDGKIDQCFRYAPRNLSIVSDNKCSADLFDRTKIVPCTEFVYSSDEKNVQTEFNVHCSDSYKLALIGTANGLGRFLFLPFTGFLSDRFGRLTIMIVGVTLASVFGLIKSFATSYLSYITLEFLESSACTCTYSANYVIAIELLCSRYRVLGLGLASLSHPIGEVILGLMAMYIHDFRVILQYMYVPGLFLFVLFWIVPESIRWLLVTGRVDRAISTMKRIARFNGKKLSDKSIDMLLRKYSPEFRMVTNSNEKGNDSLLESYLMIFKSKKLFQRFLIGCYQFAAGCFYYYGLNISATYIPGSNHYVSFIVVSAFEIPGLLLVLPIIQRYNRRISLFSFFLISSISIILTSFVSEEHSILTILLFGLGKAAIAAAFEVLYIFTAEQWPTNIRTTTMNSCSMVGRIGTMMAPFAVVLGSQYHVSLPTFLYSASAMLAAVLVYFCPETYGKRLPDTIREAKDIKELEHCIN